MNQLIGMHYINGDFCPTRADFSDENPCDGESLGMFPQATNKEIKEAVDAAHAAKKRWLAMSRIQRADLFDKLAQLLKRDHDKLKNMISLETGKNLNESHAEVIESLHMCNYAASSGRMPYGSVVASELPTKDAYVIRKPKGVIAVISPWNFPLAIGSFWSAAPALVEGNTVIHKPSELTPMTAQLVAELYQEAGFPWGVYNMIHGDGEVGSKLVKSNVDCILFTGSAEVGQSIRRHCADTWHKTCSIECGSKSACILFEDGDWGLAIDVMAASAFKLSGQRCVSSGRLLVHERIFNYYQREFINRFIGEVEKIITCRPGADGDVKLSYGPLISREQMQKVERFNQVVRDDPDAEVLYDPDSLGLNQSGHWLRPFVYTTEWADKPYLKNEVFGPHVAIIPFKDVSDAIRIYNDTDYGLALGVITDDFRTMRRCRDECNTGMLYLNGSSIGAESHLPFGGVGKSGNGWKSAAGTYRAVTEEIAVTTNYEEGKMQFSQGMK